MKRFSILISAALVFAASSAFGQGTTAAKSDDAARGNQKQSKYLSPGEVQATPEMWFYEQAMRQYNDPNLAVRRAAEFRAEQRMRRIESRKWFGLSNARPTAGVDPVHGDYSPGWTSNSFYPYRWMGGGDVGTAANPTGSRNY